MRTVTFKNVLWGAARKAGMMPEDQLDNGTAARLTEAINSAVKLAWEYYDWPEVCTVEEVTLTAHTGNNTPWLDYLDGAGQPRFISLFGVWCQDPRACEREPRSLLYHLGADGVFVPGARADKVWMRWRGPHPEYTSREYDPDTTYAVGDAVYQPADGRCYTATATPGSHAPPNITYWRETPVPAILAEALKFGGYAGFRRNEGQEASAEQIEAIMIEWLDHEVAQIAHQQQQGKRWRR